jgi:cytochrome c oxidase subunit 2
VNGTALLIAIAYAIVVALGVVIAVGLWSSTRAGLPTDPKVLAHRERGWLVAVIAILGALLFATIFFTPYGTGSARAAQVVNVRAIQFAWLLDRPSVAAGRAVEFRLRAPDVNHGFAVYDPDGKFLFQAQVVPGKTTTVVKTFTKPGTYTIYCFEFCGSGHHVMIGRLEVRG